MKDPVALALDDEAFERKLSQEQDLSPEDKRRRLSQLESQERRNRHCYEHDKFGQSFDRLEYPTDLPIIPAMGSVMPSARMLGADLYKE